jgi:hypothetical protein
MRSEDIIEIAIRNAIINQHSPLVDKLLSEFSYRIDAVESNLNSVIINDDIDTLKVFTKHNIKIQKHIAKRVVQSNAIKCLEFFIKNHPDLISSLKKKEDYKRNTTDHIQYLMVDTALERGYVDIAKLLMAEGFKTDSTDLNSVMYFLEKTESIDFLLSQPYFDGSFASTDRKVFLSRLLRDDTVEAPSIVQSLIDHNHTAFINSPYFINKVIQEKSIEVLIVLEKNNIDLSTSFKGTNNLCDLTLTPSYYNIALDKNNYHNAIQWEYPKLLEHLFLSNNFQLIENTMRFHYSIDEELNVTEYCNKEIMAMLITHCSSTEIAERTLNLLDTLNNNIEEDLMNLLSSNKPLLGTLNNNALKAYIQFINKKSLKVKLSNVQDICKYLNKYDIQNIKNSYANINALIDNASDNSEREHYASDKFINRSSKQRVNSLRRSIKGSHSHDISELILDLAITGGYAISEMINVCDINAHTLNKGIIEFLLDVTSKTPFDMMQSVMLNKKGKKNLLHCIN